MIRLKHDATRTREPSSHKVPAPCGFYAILEDIFEVKNQTLGLHKLCLGPGVGDL